MIIVKELNIDDEVIKDIMDNDFTIDPDGRLDDLFVGEGLGLLDEQSLSDQLYILRLYQEVLDTRIAEIKEHVISSALKGIDKELKGAE